MLLLEQSGILTCLAPHIHDDGSLHDNAAPAAAAHQAAIDIIARLARHAPDAIPDIIQVEHGGLFRSIN